MTLLMQVPGVDLGYILTDFITERPRRKLLGGCAGMFPREIFWIFYSLKSPFLGFLSHSDIGKSSTFFFRLRGDGLKNKSTDRIKCPLFLSRLYRGKTMSPVLFLISLGPTYFRTFFTYISVYYCLAVLKGGG